MKQLRLALIALCAATGALPTGSAAAQTEPDLFGRTGIYDLTGSPELRSLQLDHRYIRGEGPSFAEQRGLVGAATVITRRNFVYVQDTDGAMPAPPYRSGRDLYRSFDFALREVYRALPDEFLFVYLFTSFQTGVGAFFYQPEANDVFGIGMPRYDNNGASPREGFIFMNDWRSFERLYGPGGQALVRGQARSVFNQEAGHRWGAFIEIGPNAGFGSDLALGRDDSHWSYFLHTAGSPMEGNAWRENANGSFTTTTGYNNWRFSDLDLYLMGLLAPHEVTPTFAIQNPEIGDRRDLTDRPLNRASPPQIIAPITIRGRRVEVNIEDVQVRNGLRDPAAEHSPRRWRAVFVMLAGRTSGLSDDELERFEGMVDDYAAGFREGTGDRGELDYILIDAPKAPIGGACGEVMDCDLTEANYCLELAVGAPGLCTRPCDSAETCPGAWCCAQVSTAPTTLCLPSELCPGPEQPDAGACACDTSAACDPGCECDVHCAPIAELCACDLTTGCDADPEGRGDCPCDPECDPGCGCTSAGRGFGGPALALGLLGVLVLRRRR